VSLDVVVFALGSSLESFASTFTEYFLQASRKAEQLLGLSLVSYEEENFNGKLVALVRLLLALCLYCACAEDVVAVLICLYCIAEGTFPRTKRLTLDRSHFPFSVASKASRIRFESIHRVVFFTGA
jgi:hypothetical protein